MFESLKINCRPSINIEREVIDPLVRIQPQYLFALGNLHKWMFAPRGCAVLWVHPKYHDVIDPLVVSWYQDRSLRDKFFMQGTLDYSPFVTAKAAITFYQEIGGMVRLFKI